MSKLFKYIIAVIQITVFLLLHIEEAIKYEQTQWLLVHIYVVLLIIWAEIPNKK
jgi:hypothetical protein